MKITLNWLEANHACPEGLGWFKNQSESDAIKVLQSLKAQGQLEWANWTIVRVMKREQYIRYAIFAAEQVLEIFEKKYPDDKRPRLAIEAAKAVLKKNSKAARDAAGDAAGDAAWAAWDAAGDAARAAGDAARAAGDAARDAGDAARDAGDAARAAGDAARAAGAAAGDAAWAAGDAWAAEKEMRVRILDYGIGLLEKMGRG